MRIRHLVAADNLDAEGFVADPLLVRHGVIVGGAVGALASPIDPLTHLNLDFADHRLDACLVVERVEPGARALRDGERFRLASVDHAAFAHRGRVSLDAQRVAWQRAMRNIDTRSAAPSSPMTHAFLAALQLADSFFPSGMYAQSHGLEAFIAAGASGAAQIEPLLHSYLLHVAAPADALAARWAARAAAAGDLDLVAAVDARLEATKLSEEGRVASRRCGGRVLLLGAQTWGGALLPAYAQRVQSGSAPGHQPVALALIAATAGVGEDEAVLVELYTFAVSLVGAAVRLAALDHAAAQGLLLRTQPVIAEAAERQRASHWRDMGGFAPQVDIAQFRHRYADVHMFVS